MTIHVGLLRAVNVAGRNKVGMAELRDLLTDMGMKDVRSLLQSGNLVFRSDVDQPAGLESMLEEATQRRLGLKTDFLVRTGNDWRELVTDNPLRVEAQRDPSHFVVMFLKAAPDHSRVMALQKEIKGREIVRSIGRQAYITYPDGIGRSRLTTKLIEKVLGTRGTGRNWNTVLRIDTTARGL